MGKWPYNSPEWKQWLADSQAGKKPPLPAGSERVVACKNSVHIVPGPKRTSAGKAERGRKNERPLSLGALMREEVFKGVLSGGDHCFSTPTPPALG